MNRRLYPGVYISYSHLQTQFHKTLDFHHNHTLPYRILCHTHALCLIRSRWTETPCKSYPASLATTGNETVADTLRKNLTDGI